MFTPKLPVVTAKRSYASKLAPTGKELMPLFSASTEAGLREAKLDSTSKAFKVMG